MRLKHLQTFKKDLPAMGDLHPSFFESFLTDYILQKLGKQSVNTIIKLRINGYFFSLLNSNRNGSCINLATQGTLIKKNPPNTVLTKRK
jgi:hypothetical protein